MSILKNIHSKENLMFFVFFKIITIIILIWTDHSYDNVYTCGTTFDNKNKSGSNLNIRFKRYLAEYEMETEIDKTGLYNNSPNYFENNGTSNYYDNVSIYGNIKNRDSNKLKLYKTAYKHRYAKKKGLSKLDCYYEKKIFDIIDHIKVRAKSMRNDKNAYNNYIYRKFAFRFIVFALLPLLGIIIPILFSGDKTKNRIVRWTTKTCMSSSGDPCGEGFIHFTKDQIRAIFYLNRIISFTLIMIVILVFIYTFIKLIKYEKLKAGKGKMGVKEYCCFCKDVFNNKII